ncbi:hypothetical protein [Nocardioides sp.]|uniref:hypothetical protein n=1 Tax=Nocardioides sp. TaxID=35761 RepID=UPI002B275710|nr:hypothetical protein [Nocardioides sp.]
MSTIDLSTPSPAPRSLLGSLPRRVALTLPELQEVARRAGDAPLPFDLAESAPADALESRLGESRACVEDEAYATALAALHDPVDSLTRRGLISSDGTLEEGLAGAVGLLATPQVALDLDLGVQGESLRQVKAWHRQSGDAVASLATGDGLVFELAWFPTTAWPAELARVAVLPEDHSKRASQVPPVVDLPFELADAAVEAGSHGRSDLLQVLISRHEGDVLDGEGRPLPQAEVPGVLDALGRESRGRLRALVADVSRSTTTVVGVRSWVLLADGWRTLHSHHGGEPARVEIRSITAAELAVDLAPVLAEVTS